MPRPPLRIRLDDAQRAELGRWLRQRNLAPRVRRRLEGLRLADRGHTAPQIAPMLGVCEPTVRRALRRFTTGGLAALADRPIPGRPPTLSPDDLDAILDRLRHQPTGTVGELVAWLAHTRKVRISRSRLSALLGQRGCRWAPTGAPHAGPTDA